MKAVNYHVSVDEDTKDPEDCSDNYKMFRVLNSEGKVLNSRTGWAVNDAVNIKELLDGQED